MVVGINDLEKILADDSDCQISVYVLPGGTIVCTKSSFCRKFQNFLL